MTERLAFGGASQTRVPGAARRQARTAVTRDDAPRLIAAPPEGAAGAKAAPDWAWRGLIGFTAVLFLRPQDQFPQIAMLHIVELCALVGLSAMVMARLRRNLSPLPVTPEIIGLAAFGGAMLIGIPFSFWPGGSFKDFTELYLKVFLIVVLMIHALDRVERLDRFITLVVLCSTYVAAFSLFNYARGVRLVEDGRLGSAVGGMFGNPNDLALNMVVFMPFGLAAAFKPGPVPRRVIAATCALLMLATIFFTRSRGGFIGLGVMLATLFLGSVRVRPAVAVATVVAVLAAAPLAPASFWDRMLSIVDEEKDTTGSREARIELLKEGLGVFAKNPVMGIGLGQFENYDATGRKEAWNVTHNTTLQVAAELGILGLIPFFYVLARAVLAARATRRALLPPARRPGAGARPHRQAFRTDPTRETLLTIATALGPAIIGWLVCAQFASVALNWTFYYVLGIAVAARNIVLRAGHGVAPVLVTISR